jgi:hypothetical protein
MCLGGDFACDLRSGLGATSRHSRGGDKKPQRTSKHISELHANDGGYHKECAGYEMSCVCPTGEASDRKHEDRQRYNDEYTQADTQDSGR